MILPLNHSYIIKLQKNIVIPEITENIPSRQLLRTLAKSGWKRGKKEMERKKENMHVHNEMTIVLKEIFTHVNNPL